MDTAMLRHWLREAPAGLVVVALLVGIAAAYHWLYVRPPENDRHLQGQIVGFHGALHKAQLRNARVATVRLSDGNVVRVAMPSSSRADHCRAGSSVKLVRNGGLFRIAGEGCPR
jgi:hypothetical protein